MNRRKLLYGAVGLVFVVGIGIAVLMMNRGNTLAPNTYAKAKATKAAGACLEESATLAIMKNRDDIEMSAISYLIDVPAGTNVDVKIATYSDTKITGSDRYPERYGSYNFVMEKQSGGWTVTGFERCE